MGIIRDFITILKDVAHIPELVKQTDDHAERISRLEGQQEAQSFNKNDGTKAVT